MKKRKKHAKTSTRQYVLLFSVLILFTAAALILAGAASRGGEPADPNLPDTAAPLGGNGDSVPAMGELDYGDIYKVSSASELKKLADDGTLRAFYEKRGIEPTVIIADGVVFDTDVTVNCGVELLFLGKATHENGAKIRISTKDACSITLTTDSALDAFFIDAPNASLTWSGGNVPFSYEIARYMNVSKFNGSDVTDDGDRLGGTGDADVTGITLYTGKNKKTAADALCEVNGNLITLYYPYDFDSGNIKNAYVDIVSDGECTLDTSKPIDLSSPSLITVADANGETRTYRLTAQRRGYGIPILEINTSTGGAIDTREEYIPSTMILDGEEYSLGIKGRGNASWHTFPKQSYRIKLDEKAKLLGMSSNRDWVLVSNYGDPSLIRNQIASDMAKRLDGLDFTPTHVSVDLYVNGEYRGVYALAEKIEDSGSKVDLGDPVTDEAGNVTDFGFLLELGWDYSSTNIYKKDYFDLDYAIRIYIKEPEVEAKNDATFKYVYNYVKAAEDAIVSGEGWQDYLDVDSWVDWFIINELCNNTESSFHRSFFMYKPADGKLTAGPIWDYDMSFGNFVCDLWAYNKGWVTVDSTYEYVYQNWMYFLLRDEEFVSRVKERWAEVGETLYQTALESLDANAETIREAQKNNFELWDEVHGHKVGLSRASRLNKTWEEQIEYIRKFLETRYTWMDEKLSGDGSILK